MGKTRPPLKVKYLDLLSGIDINVAALKSFKVSVDRVPSDRKLSAGQTVTIKIVSVAYTKGVPDITGELVSTKVKLTVSHLSEVAGWL